MSRSATTLLAAALMLGVAACQDSGPTTASSELLLADGFETVPLGFEEIHHTFGSASDSGTTEWRPGVHPDRRHRHRDGLMCGGLWGLFGPGFDFGLRAGWFRGVLHGHCAFDPTVNRVVCDTVTRSGLTITASAAFYDAAGVVQSGFEEESTDKINVQLGVTGTIARRDGHSSRVAHASDRTVSGLAPGSTERTIDGTATGLETTTGSDETGAFVAVRSLGDTLQGVVVPAEWGRGVYPIAGTVIRAMEVTVTHEGQSPVGRSRREVLTFDGSNVATLVITQNGVTKTCSVPLPHGRPSCE